MLSSRKDLKLKMNLFCYGSTHFLGSAMKEKENENFNFKVQVSDVLCEVMAFKMTWAGY